MVTTNSPSRPSPWKYCSSPIGLLVTHELKSRTSRSRARNVSLTVRFINTSKYSGLADAEFDSEIVLGHIKVGVERRRNREGLGFDH